MCKNCNGFTFVEAIVSLALLLFITAALLPLVTHIMVERKNAALKSEAQQLLNAEMNNGDRVSEKTVTMKGIVYTISWTNEGNGIKKACVRWNDYADRTVERCGYVKR